MPEKPNNRIDEANQILNNVFKPNSLKDLFERRLGELQLSPTSALDLLGIQYRSLKGILEGTQAMVDMANIFKIASFLQLPRQEVVKLYVESLELNLGNPVIASDKIKFIQENFDLVALKKVGFIDSLTDFAEIEKRITNFLGLKSIFHYVRPTVKPAFSAGLVKPKNELTRSLWINSAITYFEDINNPYDFNRKGLIEYFPNIRWHSMNVEFGLFNIIRDLFKLGITVIYQAPLPALHLRGATFTINDKPCIVLTNHIGFYGTLWFALVHELFHVLFDWDEIRRNCYHLSDDEDNELLVQEKEREANNFAREYLLPKEKMEMVKSNINDPFFVREFAKQNHVHESIIYVFNAYDSSKTNRVAWARTRRNEPDITLCVSKLENPWSKAKPISDVAGIKKTELYN